ncbi:hypothetical protein [Sulfurovum sp. TSL1]|uniref:hypothetical protein n=1 Tax=Sulfurovum sp. TSL1 TaxID=2826994 RepID=UPI001CC39B8F|nr:hypothetical protein [Sulfurovum sp. TSL1]GIT98523.1 hypothetical protein TSL1_13440 [Sulfurovum sp. TSL1]
MSSIDRKIRRNKKNPMVDEYVETVMTFVLNGSKEDITYYSYNREFFKKSDELRVKFAGLITKLMFDLCIKEIEIFTFSDIFKQMIIDIEKNENIQQMNFTVENDKVMFQNKFVGYNLGKILIGQFIVYFAGYKLFFEDTQTNKRYLFKDKYDCLEVA